VRNPDGWPVDEYAVKEVVVDANDSLTITGDHWTFGITAKEAKGKPVPEPGQKIVLLGGIGHQIRGIFINDVEYRYITREQAEKERAEWLANYDREKEEAFYANIRDWINRKNALDEPFRKRLDRFAAKGFKEFWKDSGAYELFAVEQANKLYRHATDTLGLSNPEPWLKEFYDSSWESQKIKFPDLDEGHSGNTFGAMVGLAKAVARGQEI
jgi:hypothetical protein